MADEDNIQTAHLGPAPPASLGAQPEAVMATFSPSSNMDDFRTAETFVQERSDAELGQIIIVPTGLVHRLPGFTRDHLGTADERVIVDLARSEANWRLAAKARHISQLALWVSVGSLGVAVLSLFLSHH
jgi:hypothetical protein